MTMIILTPILDLFMHNHVMRFKVERRSSTVGHPTCRTYGNLLTLTNFSNLHYSDSQVTQAQPMRQWHQLTPAAVAVVTVAVDMDGTMENTRKKNTKS
jgi:hypothetical protein